MHIMYTNVTNHKMSLPNILQFQCSKINQTLICVSIKKFMCGIITKNK